MPTEQQHEDIKRRLEWLETHYSKFNDEFGDVKADVRWLVKFFWVIATSSIGSLLAAFFNLIR